MPSLPFRIRSRKSTLCSVVVEVEVDVVGEADVGVEVPPTKVSQVKVRLHQKVKVVTRDLSIRISRLESGTGVKCIINTGKTPFSVPNRPHVHGRMSSKPNHNNENLTSLAVIQLQ